ncbi:MAG: hypothetical protein GC185_01280 [Alphaproteobacteria bacterium]|nr:hypothetical protein [Alphaproteobacteria bacterium]
MKKSLKSDFDKARARAELFAEQAMVVTLGMGAASVTTTTTAPGGEPVVEKKSYEPKEMQAEFLDYLKERGIGHAVILQDDNILTFAVKREKDLEAEGIRGVVRDFFSGGRQIAMSFEAYYQKSDSTFEIKNAFLKPFSKTRRDVSRAVKGF